MSPESGLPRNARCPSIGENLARFAWGYFIFVSHIFADSEFRGSTPSQMDRIRGDHSLAPVHRGGEECGSRLPEPSSSGSGVGGLWRMWPVTVDLFATSLNFCLQLYFSPLNSPLTAGTDAFLQDWNGLQAYAIPSFALVCQVLTKLQSYRGTELTPIAPFGLGVVLGPPECIDDPSCRPAQKEGSTQTAPLPPSSPTFPCASASCLETFQ